VGNWKSSSRPASGSNTASQSRCSSVNDPAATHPPPRTAGRIRRTLHAHPTAEDAPVTSRSAIHQLWRSSPPDFRGTARAQRLKRCAFQRTDDGPQRQRWAPKRIAYPWRHHGHTLSAPCDRNDGQIANLQVRRYEKGAPSRTQSEPKPDGHRPDHPLAGDFRHARAPLSVNRGSGLQNRYRSVRPARRRSAGSAIRARASGSGGTCLDVQCAEQAR
jgi:hypothetical protein